MEGGQGRGCLDVCSISENESNCIKALRHPGVSQTGELRALAGATRARFNMCVNYSVDGKNRIIE